VDGNVGAQQLTGNATEMLKVVGASRVVLVDNLSGLRYDASDLLAQMVTGAGLRSRAFYQNDEPFIARVMAAVVLNGITVGSLRGDLASRTLRLALPVIEGGYAPVGDIDGPWRAALPALTGRLLDLFADVLAVRPKISRDGLQRMADFHVTLRAVDQVLGTNGEAVFLELISSYVDELADTEPLVPALASFLAKGDQGLSLLTGPAGRSTWNDDGSWTGSTTALWKLVCDEHRELPSAPNALGKDLARLQPVLKRAGVLCERSRGKDATRWTLSLIDTPAASAVQPV